jgi:hypothetical protein
LRRIQRVEANLPNRLEGRKRRREGVVLTLRSFVQSDYRLKGGVRQSVECLTVIDRISVPRTN